MAFPTLKKELQSQIKMHFLMLKGFVIADFKVSCEDLKRNREFWQN
jgi:hypothetical protein